MWFLFLRYMERVISGADSTRDTSRPKEGELSIHVIV